MGATLTSQLATLQRALIQGVAMRDVAALLGRMEGVDPKAAQLVLRRSQANPIWSLMRMPRPTRIAGPLQEADRLNAARRAAFLMQVLRRVSNAAREGDPTHSLLRMQARLSREASYARAHVAASQKRELAARGVQGAYEKHGDILGWYARMDAKTTAECRAANGRNFRADSMPPIGYPGAVHPNCRCVAGPPHNSSGRVADVRPDGFAWADK